MNELRKASIIVRRENKKRSSLIDYYLREGALVAMLPGVYRWADVEETFELRVLAVQKWQVNGIFYGSTAARLSWWPEVKDDVVKVITSCRKPEVPWLELSRQKVHADHLVTIADWRLVSPELSILQMSLDGHGRAIAEGLRREAVTIQGLRGAHAQLPLKWQGRALVAQVLEEAKEEPWSTLELDAHQLLRAASITGWKTNVKIVLPNGKTFFGDVLFHRERIILELDGRQFHTHAELDANNDRRNDLVAAGWRVFNFSGATLDSMVPLIHPVLREARAAWKSDRLPLLPLVPDLNEDDGTDGWEVA